MKNLIPLFLCILLFSACKEEKKEDIVINDTMTISENTRTPQYPESVTAIMNAHGGVDRWNKMNNLCFEMDGKDLKEIHTTSLKDRKSKIETEDWTIGYDGKDVWLFENKAGSYKGDARFYHNLMFYFYAMPFVLGDEGINYTKMEPVELDGKSYNATKIAYNAGVGDAPDDEYILYSDPESNQMKWLAYTVTYKSGEKSDQWHFIKYDKWQEVNGLQIPEKLTWYNSENGEPTDENKDMRFNKITVTETTLEGSVFAKPEGAVVVPR